MKPESKVQALAGALVSKCPGLREVGSLAQSGGRPATCFLVYAPVIRRRWDEADGGPDEVDGIIRWMLMMLDPQKTLSYRKGNVFVHSDYPACNVMVGDRNTDGLFAVYLTYEEKGGLRAPPPPEPTEPAWW